VHRRAAGHWLVPFPDIQFIFPAALGDEKPGLIFLFAIATNRALLDQPGHRSPS